MVKENNVNVFLELVRAGLWEKDARLLQYGIVDYEEVMRLAEEQSVVGLVTAGLEHVTDVKVPQEILLQFIGSTLQIEQQNKSMNEFLARLMKRLRSANVYGLLVKGQGVAQCYEKPLWRASGDIDLLLDYENYEKAKTELLADAENVHMEVDSTKHQAFVINVFDVELHGRMPFGMSGRVDHVIDEVISGSLLMVNGEFGKGAGKWKNGDTNVFLPSPDEHVVLVFTHFLHHFFIEGVGLRQICDWCRLLWTYKDSLNLGLLESRIKKAGLMSEWKAFASLAVNTLGMPKDAMPFYDARFHSKIEKVLQRVLKSGNMGHNNDLSYRAKYTGMKYKAVAMWRRICDFASLVPVFPLDAPRFFVRYVVGKV